MQGTMTYYQPGFIALVFLLGSVRPFAAGANSRVFNNARDGFSISLPSDWKEIPLDVLKKFSGAMAKLAPNMEEQEYQYGYQLASFDQWLECPYIVIQVQNTGRVAEGQFAKLAQKKEIFEREMKTVETNLSLILSQSQMSEPVYDVERHALWIRSEVNVEFVGKVKTLSAALLTEKGTLNIYCFAKESEFPGYAPLFETIANSIQFGEGMKYKPRDSDTNRIDGLLNKIGNGAVLGVAIGAVVVLIVVLLRRRRTE